MSARAPRHPRARRAGLPAAPSWAPAFFAFALALARLRHLRRGLHGPRLDLLDHRRRSSPCSPSAALIRDAIRDYYRLPRKQQVRGAVLPVETISRRPKRG